LRGNDVPSGLTIYAPGYQVPLPAYITDSCKLGTASIPLAASLPASPGKEENAYLCLLRAQPTPRRFAHPRGRLASSSPLSLKSFQDEDQFAEDGAVVLPLECYTDLLRVADI